MRFPARKWTFGIDASSRQEKQALSILDPIGQLEPRDEAKSKEGVSKKFLTTRAWEMAIHPGSQFFMTAFMFWMMGSGIHIMNIMFIFYQIPGPIQGLLNVNQVFQGLQESAEEHGVDLLVYKLLYVACQLAILLFILYRFNSMGLLPTSASDWLAMVPIKPASHFAAGSMI